MKKQTKELFKILSIIFGVLLIIFGLIGLFTPLVPGSLMILAGLLALGYHPLKHIIKNRKKRD